MSLLQVRWRSYVGCLDPGSGWMECLWADFDLILSENVFQSWHFSRIYLVGNTLGVRFIWWLLFRPGNVQFPTGQDSWQICVCDGIEWWDRDVAGLFWWRTQLMWRNDVHLQDHYDDDMVNMMMTWLLRWWYRVVFFNWPPRELAKCWPVSNRFRKNVWVPDWPPPMIVKNLSVWGPQCDPHTSKI